jgi:hypothetical protein
MARSLQKSVRKLVTLSPELAERVEKYRASSGAASESDALKALIEDGLKLKDRSSDLFERFESATAKGQSIGEIINLLAADHPLVYSTFLSHDTLNIHLKMEQDQLEERFSFDRMEKKWTWERRIDGYGDDRWETIRPKAVAKYDDSYMGTTKSLDDEIPF